MWGARRQVACKQGARKTEPLRPLFTRSGSCPAASQCSLLLTTAAASITPSPPLPNSLVAEAALNAEEQQLLKNTMARVERLAQAAADVRWACGARGGCTRLSRGGAGATYSLPAGLPPTCPLSTRATNPSSLAPPSVLP